ncbi:MAG: DUF3102 domain-containing protein [Leptolyngbyaceae cyanobacterium CSU_1_4]|nr:DUF3102 domain-containing protein [Leptolyngbyaceae cyanobacterium CSU_1_4]
MIAKIQSTQSTQRRQRKPAVTPSTFKEGDRVEIIVPEGRAPLTHIPEGAVGTVTYIGRRTQIKGSLYIALDHPPDKNKRNDVLVDVQRLKLLVELPEPEKRLDLVSVGEGDRVRGRTLKGDRVRGRTLKGDVVEGVVESLGIKYVKLTTGKSVWIESVEIIERAASPVETDEIQVVAIVPDLFRKFEKLVSCEKLIQDKIKGIFEWDERDWVAIGSSADFVVAVEVVSQLRWGKPTYSYRDNPGSYTGQLVKHRQRYYVLTDIKIKFVPIENTVLSQLKLLIENVTDNLFWMDECSSIYAPEQDNFEAYKTWEIHIDRDLSSEDTFAGIDLVHRASGGWWGVSKAKLGWSDEAEAIEWTKQIIDQVEAIKARLNDDSEQDPTPIAESYDRQPTQDEVDEANWGYQSDIKETSILSQLLEKHGLEPIQAAYFQGHQPSKYAAFSEWQLFYDSNLGWMGLIYQPSNEAWIKDTELNFGEAIIWLQALIPPIEHEWLEAKGQLSLLSQPSTLSTLETEIEQIYSQAQESEETAIRAGRSAVQLYYELGGKLLEAKAQIKHGEWLPWLKARNIPERKAQRAIEIVNNWDVVSKSDTVTDLTLSDVSKLLKASKRLKAESEPTLPQPQKDAAAPEIVTAEVHGFADTARVAPSASPQISETLGVNVSEISASSTAPHQPSELAVEAPVQPTSAPIEVVEAPVLVDSASSDPDFKFSVYGLELSGNQLFKLETHANESGLSIVEYLIQMVDNLP